MEDIVITVSFGNEIAHHRKMDSITRKLNSKEKNWIVRMNGFKGRLVGYEDQIGNEDRGWF